MLGKTSTKSGDISHDRTVRNQPPSYLTGAGASAQSESTLEWRGCDWQFSSVLSSVGVMRRELRNFLDDTVLSDDEIEDLVLAASEAANNAIEHAQDPRDLYFDVSSEYDDGAVTIVISDHGRWREPTSPSDRGRGLAMMRALADTTVTARAHGTTVTIRNHRVGFGALAEPRSTCVQ
jgi:anti-sigma regulatory factor (Ser/Thr protein kinase)